MEWSFPPPTPPSLQDFPLPFGNLNRQSAQIILLTNLKAGSGSVRLGYFFLFFFYKTPGKKKKHVHTEKENAPVEGLALNCAVSA